MPSIWPIKNLPSQRHHIRCQFLILLTWTDNSELPMVLTNEMNIYYIWILWYSCIYLVVLYTCIYLVVLYTCIYLVAFSQMPVHVQCRWLQEEGVPVFSEDWRSGFLSGKKMKFCFLSVKKWRMGEITGVKTEEVKIDSLKMWKSKKVKTKWEERLLKCEDREAWTPWYPPHKSKVRWQEPIHQL